MILPWQAPASFDFRVEPGRGLTVVSRGVPIIRGSYFQVVSPDWSRSYFGSTSAPQKIEKVDADTVRVAFKSTDGTVQGTHTYHREGDRLKVRYEFAWSGNGEPIVELAAGLIWVPALERAGIAAPAPGIALEGRKLGPNATEISLNGPLGRLGAKASTPLTLFDARRYPQSWAEGKDVLWYGDLSLPLKKGTTTFDLEWQMPTGTLPALEPKTVTLAANRIPNAELPDETRPVLIPRPENDHLNWDKPIEITGAWKLPVGVFDHYDDLKRAIARRFEYPVATAKTKPVPIDGGVSKTGFLPGGYRLTLDPERGVSIIGEEDEGLRNGVERFASMVFAKGGKLWVPSGYLYDQPRMKWRGVHLFVGPKARAFQTQLATKVLAPLGINHVVLQCERTAWAATPGTETTITMPKTELAALFKAYRTLGIDPIPLIQSFGHMEWLFANGKNLDLALNPEVLYAIDPRKPEAQNMLKAIWDEAITLLKPSTVHFGLDEVDMRGYSGDDATLTELWERQLRFLNRYAADKQVQPMLWGDQALAPGEAPDAALGDSKEEAVKRRAAISKGAYIADWHYKADPKPETFEKVLDLWKFEGFRPIASGWYRPENIRGLALAAGNLKAGYLQTTWAGYESSESAMLEHFDQFSAMVLAADYAWSGRRELPNELPYDPGDVFRKLYFGKPSPVRPRPGAAYGKSTGNGFTIGTVRFAQGLDLRLGSVLKPSSEDASTLNLDLNAKGRELNLALMTQVPAEEGEAVAELIVERVGAPAVVKRLIYGRDIRAGVDPKPLSLGERLGGGPGLVRVGLDKFGAKRITLRPLNPYVGLRLMGVTAVD